MRLQSVYGGESTRARESAVSSGRFGAVPLRRPGEQVDPACPPSPPEPDHRRGQALARPAEPCAQRLEVPPQYPIDRFIVDFACVEARLVVEVDGATHSTERERLYDAARARII